MVRITAKYAELTPYQFANNRPIQGVDLDGNEVLLITGYGTGAFMFDGFDVGAGVAIGRMEDSFNGLRDSKVGARYGTPAAINGSIYCHVTH